jgi:hypothetical protein
LPQLPKEFAICLIPNVNFDLRLFKLFASRININPDDPGLRPEIMFPHLKRTAPVDPELHHRNLPAAKGMKMSMIDLEVVRPFVDEPSVIPYEILFERIWLRILD